MEEGTKNKKTIFVGGISDDTDETTLYDLSKLVLAFHSDTHVFVLFASSNFVGDIIEVQLTPPASQYHQNPNPNGTFSPQSFRSSPRSCF